VTVHAETLATAADTMGGDPSVSNAAAGKCLVRGHGRLPLQGTHPYSGSQVQGSGIRITVLHVCGQVQPLD
jgi:hypothetical protein